MMKKLSKRAKANIAVIVCMVIFWASWALYANRESEKFYKASIRSVVIDSNDWWKRSIKFILADGNYVYFIFPVGDKIQIGDSVFKPANTNVFEVYRKNDSGVYYFFRKYDDAHAVRGVPQATHAVRDVSEAHLEHKNKADLQSANQTFGFVDHIRYFSSWLLHIGYTTTNTPFTSLSAL